jgi:hypothetical protein
MYRMALPAARMCPSGPRARQISQHVTEAVTRQLEPDLLTEHSVSLAAEYWPVPEEYLAEARAIWPDTE